MKARMVESCYRLRLRTLVLLVAALLVSCTRFRPRTVAGDRFDYSAAIARSRNEQMLLNIVRMRYSLPTG